MRRVETGAMASNPPGSSAPATVSDVGMDLHQLLECKGFAHWHSLLLKLLARYDGWLADYEFDPAYDPDYRPLAEVFGVLGGIAPMDAGDDRALAQALLGCDFLFRSGIDRATGTSWDALRESYREFTTQRTLAAPLWGLELPWPAQEFISRLLAQLGRPATGFSCGG